MPLGGKSTARSTSTCRDRSSVLETGLVIGFVGRETPLGHTYLEHRSESVFYREATFFSSAEVHALLSAQGFVVRGSGQTLFRPLAETTELEAMRSGTGDGAFVVLAADRDSAGS